MPLYDATNITLHYSNKYTFNFNEIVIDYKKWKLFKLSSISNLFSQSIKN